MQISPEPPSGTALPLSSRSSISVEEIGSPMAPVYSVMSNGLIVAAGEVSVSP